MQEEDTLRALVALGHPMRLRAFRALVVAGDGGLTPGTMAEGLGIAATALSFHLKELSNAGLVTQERDGRYLIYRAAYGQMNDLIGYLTENCCRGAACGVPAVASCCSAP